jgi:hypothetical protein
LGRVLTSHVMGGDGLTRSLPFGGVRDKGVDDINIGITPHKGLKNLRKQVSCLEKDLWYDFNANGL